MSKRFPLSQHCENLMLCSEAKTGGAFNSALLAYVQKEIVNIQYPHFFITARFSFMQSSGVIPW